MKLWSMNRRSKVQVSAGLDILADHMPPFLFQPSPLGCHCRVGLLSGTVKELRC